MMMIADGKPWDQMPIKYGPCDKCGGLIKPCRCTLLAERDALAEQVKELQAALQVAVNLEKERHPPHPGRIGEWERLLDNGETG